MKKNKMIIASASDNKRMLIVTATEEFGNDLKQVKGVAYSGGVFHQWWSQYPCITNLAGLEIAPQIPLMYNHVNDPEYRLGEVSVTKSETALNIVDGGIDPGTEKGAAIIAAGKKCPWQLSHGAEIIEMSFLPEGEKRTVNGREITGPINVFDKSILREVSVVAIGADADTSLRIAAGFGTHATQKTSQGGQMNKKLREFIVAKFKLAGTLDDAAIVAHLVSIGTTVEAMQKEMESKSAPAPEPVKAAADPAPAAPVPAPVDVKAAAEAAVKAERDRVTGIRAALKDCPTMVDKAIECGWTVDYCKDMAANVKAAMAGLQSASANIIVKDKPQTSAAVLEAALEFRAGIDEKTIVASHGEQVADQADKMRGISLREALVAACGLKGVNVGVTLDHDVIQAGFSTTDLPQILSNVAHKAMLKEFNAYPVIATRLCATGDLADYKEALRVRMTDVGNLEVVPVGGEVPNSTLGEEAATNRAERYAKAFWLDEALIINDDLGMFLKIPRLFGARGARLIDQVFFRRLLANPTQADGNALFSAAHANYLTGSTYALSIAAVKAMRTLFLNQTDADGEPISIAPKFMLVPSTLEAAAQELVQSALIVSGSTTAQGATNIISKWGLEVVASPYLENAKYTGHSSTGWYLFADPAQVDTFEIGYLKGQRVPTVERGQFDLGHFGVGYRVRFDFGIREQDHRGMTFATGVA
ncbi:MAG: Mu-like prophage major head subunit gpT family protein [Lentisphaeria bacterium]|nr:Mu-like prophage major head subunit gpT family protein [Lentisphaeria bacterium]